MRQRPQTLKLLFSSTHTEETALSPGALALLGLQLSIDKPLTGLAQLPCRAPPASYD